MHRPLLLPKAIAARSAHIEGFALPKRVGCDDESQHSHKVSSIDESLMSSKNPQRFATLPTHCCTTAKMRRFFFLPLVISLTLPAASLYSATPPRPNTVSPWDDDAEYDEASRRKAIEEAVKLQEERKKAKAAWEAGLSSEQRKQGEKERERKSRLPLPEDGYDWHSEAGTYKLTANDQEQLEKQKFAIGSTEFLQSFEPYDAPKGPVFITSDSLLNVYHILFEDSFREVEIRRAGQLKTYLETMLNNAKAVAAKLPFPAAQYQPAWVQAQLAMGPAMKLLGTSIEFFDEPLRREIEAEVSRIRDAQGTLLPKWLEPATPDFLAIDYGRFQPMGFYVGSRLLEDYFRAVRWLQLIPFRIERDNEFGSIALLCANLPVAVKYSHESYLKSYASFMGRADGRYLDSQTSIIPREPDPVFAASLHAQLDEARKRYTPSRPDVEDTLRLPDQERAPKALEPFHLLASYALPESVIFQKLINKRKTITGLQFAALNGSARAHSQLEESQKDEIIDQTIAKETAVDRWRGDDDALYSKYREVVASLFAKADPDAPAFIASDAWAAKSNLTALASWVQMRHTFTLQTKISVCAACAFTRPPGFIEPNPAFLRAYVSLVQTTQTKLDEFKLFEPSAASVANTLLERAALCDEYVVLSKRLGKRKFRETLVYQKVTNLNDSDIFETMPENEETYAMRRAVFSADEAQRVDVLPKYSQFLRDIAEKCLQGKIPVVDKSDDRSLKARWTCLENLASRMETLLQKQLRKQDWDKEEAAFIEDYGSQMAYLMGYFGNVHSPQDDAPRWVEIANYPDRGSLFAVATGRPRAFYVLYPWKGIEVLSVGAVFPYFEYEGKKRLTDDEWTQRLSTAEAVPVPNWARPLYLSP